MSGNKELRKLVEQFEVGDVIISDEPWRGGSGNPNYVRGPHKIRGVIIDLGPFKNYRGEALERHPLAMSLLEDSGIVVAWSTVYFSKETYDKAVGRKTGFFLRNISHEKRMAQCKLSAPDV